MRVIRKENMCNYDLDNFKFQNERIQKAVDKGKKIESSKIKDMDSVSTEIKVLELLLKKWDYPFTSLQISDLEEAIIWCPIQQRLLFTIALGATKPLIEMPWVIREKVYKNGHLADFFEKIIEEKKP
jgi:hypothetical protein